ncbi:hypothetical protein BJX63DRAFT_283717 [Aspergillus granulosus]|uniref:Uncharacterized protein n=1 Tax=Aspergillus granulosus TaxID=176169 RepID=A0ABR4I198_9EURO
MHWHGAQHFCWRLTTRQPQHKSIWIRHSRFSLTFLFFFCISFLLRSDADYPHQSWFLLPSCSLSNLFQFPLHIVAGWYFARLWWPGCPSSAFVYFFFLLAVQHSEPYVATTSFSSVELKQFKSSFPRGSKPSSRART